MSNESEQVEQDLKRFEEYPLDLGSPLTPYGAALHLLGQARKDAKDWMTRYKIEAEECDRLDKEVKNRLTTAEEAATDYRLRMQKAERKARLLANVIATLIDSEEFV